MYCSDPAVKKYIPEKTKFLQRPEWLDGDLVKGFDIYREFINVVDADVYVLAHTTSPFIRLSSCQIALNRILDGSHDSSFSAERIQTFAWYQGKPINYDLNDVPRTQDIEPIWAETSAFFMFKKKFLRFTDVGLGLIHIFRKYQVLKLSILMRERIMIWLVCLLRQKG